MRCLGDLQSQVAARHHDAVDVLQNGVEVVQGFVFFDLGDQRDIGAELMHLAAGVKNILAVAHEGQRHQVDLVGDAKRQVFFVFGGQGANVERAARKVNAFVRTQDAADDDAALDVVSCRPAALRARSRRRRARSDRLSSLLEPVRENSPTRQARCRALCGSSAPGGRGFVSARGRRPWRRCGSSVPAGLAGSPPA